jgi:hypothetical protein
MATLTPKKGVFASTSNTITKTLDATSNIAIMLEEATDIPVVMLREIRLEAIHDAVDNLSKKYSLNKDEVYASLVARD